MNTEPHPLRLEGRTALVTGAASGLGEAIAVGFARQGASVACFDLDGKRANGVARQIRQSGGHAMAGQVDVADEASIDEMVRQLTDSFGPLHVAVANAGVAGSGRAGTTSLADWNRVIAVNLTGVWLTMRAALGLFERQHSKGSVICIASAGGVIGVPGIASYSAAKAGVIGLVRQAAVDYGPQGIRINAISPGTVLTPLVRSTYERGGSIALGSDGDIERLLNETTADRFPLQRIGTTDDITNAAIFLASEESAWVTGHNLVVDGGMTVK